MKQLIQTNKDKCNTYKGCGDSGNYFSKEIGKKLKITVYPLDVSVLHGKIS